ncbi:MAG: type II toxin-antitoxin system ParD family antitoxin [Proteobacteria bacterium]|nr:type II toxin-antitoxin system ParD family antitoxin [Pseudomonadota bacterium]
MATLNISLPDQLREFINSRVGSGEYQSASDYLRDLIRHDKENLEHLLVEGVDSGKSRPLDMKSIRQKAQNILKGKQGE